MASAQQELYRRWINELWAGNTDITSELLSSDFIGHWPDHNVNGPDELAKTVMGVHQMFENLRFQIEIGPILDGEWIAGRWIGTGITDGKSARFSGNDVMRIEDGKILEYWIESSVGV